VKDPDERRRKALRYAVVVAIGLAGVAVGFGDDMATKAELVGGIAVLAAVWCVGYLFGSRDGGPPPQVGP
jgi:hypothetical protein